MPRQRFTYEERIDQAKQKIREKPENALKEIGKFLVREIKKDTPRGKGTHVYYKNGKKFKIKAGRLRKSIGYWYRKKEKDLLVGSKAFYAPFFEFGTSQQRKEPFFEKAVMKQVDVIQEMIKDALKELTGR